MLKAHKITKTRIKLKTGNSNSLQVALDKCLPNE